MNTFKVMAITHLKLPVIKAKLGINFSPAEDVLGNLFLATNKKDDPISFQIRVRENSPEPATEIMLPLNEAAENLDNLLMRLSIERDDLFWIHPRAGGTLRRQVVDDLIANLEEREPLVQILIGPRQVGKTTSVFHLIKEWGVGTHYASADTIVGDYGPWLEMQWQEALSKGEGALLVIDEIQKVPKWEDHVKMLWDKTKKRGIRVVVLGSTSLNHCLTHTGRESLAGRFNSIYVPHWSYLETYEAFGTNVSDFSLYGGYPKAMELVSDSAKWFDYVGGSIINPIIDVDIYQHGKFKRIENLRRAFKVFCEKVSYEINYTQFLNEIQQSGNTEMVKRYLEGYYDSFLFSPLPLIDDNGHVDSRRNAKLMLNCPAVYTFGRHSLDDFSKDSIRFQQSVASELKKIPNNTFGYWEQSDDVGMDLFMRTSDNNVFGIVVEGSGKSWSKTKSYEVFRKTFKNSRIITITQSNFDSLLNGQRAFLEANAI